MAGRKPKPTQLKILTGNPGKRPLPVNEPTPTAGLRKCPKHLKGAAKKFWLEWAPILDGCGISTEADTQAFIYAAEQHGEYVYNSERIAIEGRVIEQVGSMGQITRSQNPHWNMAQQALKNVTRFLTEFGMTPSSRSRVEKTGPKEDPDSLESFRKEVL